MDVLDTWLKCIRWEAHWKEKSVPKSRFKEVIKFRAYPLSWLILKRGGSSLKMPKGASSRKRDSTNTAHNCRFLRIDDTQQLYFPPRMTNELKPNKTVEALNAKRRWIDERGEMWKEEQFTKSV